MELNNLRVRAVTDRFEVDCTLGSVQLTAGITCQVIDDLQQGQNKEIGQLQFVERHLQTISKVMESGFRDNGQRHVALSKESLQPASQPSIRASSPPSGP